MRSKDKFLGLLPNDVLPYLGKCQTERDVREIFANARFQSGGMIDPFAIPGMGTPLLTTENVVLAGVIASWQAVGCTIVSTAVDPGSATTTTLRKGLIIGAQGNFQLVPGVNVKQFDPGATDGSQYAVGILLEDVNMLNPVTGVAAQKFGRILWNGYVRAINVYQAVSGSASGTVGPGYNVRRQLANRIWFDDGLIDNGLYLYAVYAQGGTYTVLVTDNNKMFSTRGQAGASTFTLPALASVGPSWRCTFYNEVAQNMTVTAPANTLVTFNNLTATSVAFSTGGNLIGACVEVTVNDAGTKYLTKFSGANTVTVS